MNRYIVAASILAVVALGASPTRAQAWSQDQYSQIRLLSETSGVGDGQPVLMGVEITTRPGWKTYWRAAGESGLPPHFEWLAVENTAAPTILWPAPERFIALGDESYGYTGGVVLPFLVKPVDIASPVRVQLRVQYAVCLEICVPEQADIGVTLEPGAAIETPAAAILRAALARVPTMQGEATLPRIAEVKLEQGEYGTRLIVSAVSGQRFLEPDLLVDGAPDFLFSAPEASYADARTRAQFVIEVQPLDPDLSLHGQLVTLTLVDRDRAVQTTMRLAQ